METCRPAFIGAAEMAVPALHTGFCPLLNEWVGGADCFGEGVDPVGRWRTFITSGCRQAENLMRHGHIFKTRQDKP